MKRRQQRLWWDAGVPFVRATVVSTWGSAPLPVGSVMLVGPADEVVGGVSGGCVEGDVVVAARQVRATGTPVLRRYGVADADAQALGLLCGGTIEVYLERVWAGDLPAEPAPPEVAEPAASAALAGVRGAGRPRLLVYGASEFAVALAHLGAFLGWRVTLCDARAVFATPERFPAADDVVVQWPHLHLQAQAAAGDLDGRTAVAVLTHDAKFDVPVLVAALGLLEDGLVGYVGMIGSRATREDRLARLREAGVGAAALAGLHSPIGLDIGAQGAAEVALSIMAEVVAERHGRPGGSMSLPVG